jgi:hypothetical protein
MPGAFAPRPNVKGAFGAKQAGSREEQARCRFNQIFNFFRNLMPKNPEKIVTNDRVQ